MTWTKDNGKFAKDAAEQALEAAEYFDEKKPLIDKFTDEQTNLQAQINQLVVEGDSSPEAAQARVGVDDAVYDTLKARLDAEHEQVTRQLAQIAQISINHGTRITAHRGLSNAYPENTLLAIEKACQAGYQVIEIDIQPTSDQHIVVIHDTTLDRTTNGTGTVTQKTLAEIKNFVIDGGVGATRYIGMRVPTLDEALAVMRKYGVTPMVEFKVINDYSQLDSIVNSLRAYGFEYNSIIISPVTYLIDEFRKRGGKSECMLLAEQSESNTNFLLANKPSGYTLNYAAVNENTVYQLQSQDLSIAVYTVNDVSTARNLKKWGANYITTDAIKEVN